MLFCTSKGSLLILQKAHLPDDPMFKLVSQVYKIAPGVLTEHGKTKYVNSRSKNPNQTVLMVVQEPLPQR
jgi:hypothetical protein